jgi:hypothetical protein
MFVPQNRQGLSKLQNYMALQFRIRLYILDEVINWGSVASTERMAGKQRSGNVEHEQAVRKWGSIVSTERIAGKQRSGNVVRKGCGPV